MRLNQQELRESNGIGIAKAKEEEFQERQRDGNVKCLEPREEENLSVEGHFYLQ